MKNKLIKMVKSGFLLGCMMLLTCLPSWAQSEIQDTVVTDSVHINLDKAIEIALTDAPTIKIANRNVDIKKYYKKEQIAALFPDASLSGNYQRTLKKQKMAMEMGGQVMEIEVGMWNNYTGGLNFGLPIIMPALWTSVKLSQMDVNMALEAARSSKIEMVNRVKQGFYTYLLTRESYDVLQQNYNNQKLNNDLITNKYNQGLVSEFEKLRSDVSLQNMKPNVSSAQKTFQLATMNLKILLGMDIDEPVIFDGSLSDYEEMVLNNPIPTADSILIEKNSSLKQLEIGTQQMKQSKKVIASSACPSLTLGGNYTFMSMNNDFHFKDYRWYPYSMIGLSLKVPIVSWAGTSFKMKATDLNIANMEDQRVDLERGLRVQIQSSINDMQQAVEDLASNKETLLQAQRAYEIAQKQYEVGLNTWLDLNTAELALVSTQLTYSQSLFNYLSAMSNLDSIMGKDYE